MRTNGSLPVGRLTGAIPVRRRHQSCEVGLWEVIAALGMDPGRIEGSSEVTNAGSSLGEVGPLTLAARLYPCPASEGLRKVIRLEHESSLRPLRHGTRPEGRRNRRAQTGPISLLEMPANDDRRNQIAPRPNHGDFSTALLRAQQGQHVQPEFAAARRRPETACRQ